MDEQGTSLAETKAQERRRRPRRNRRLLCGAAVLVVLLGLALLGPRWWPHAVPLRKIADLQPALHLALIRIAGHATGDARTFREAGQLRSVRFTVADDTGALAVCAEGQQAEQMALFDRIPRAGDTLEIVGRLSLGGNEPPTLRIQTGDALKLKRAVKAVPPLTGVRAMPADARR